MLHAISHDRPTLVALLAEIDTAFGFPRGALQVTYAGIIPNNIAKADPLASGALFAFDVSNAQPLFDAQSAPQSEWLTPSQLFALGPTSVYYVALPAGVVIQDLDPGSDPLWTKKWF